MVIRVANPDDFKAIQQLNYQISEYEFEHSCSTINVEYSFLEQGVQYLKDVVNAANGNFCYVYEENAEVLGYVSLKRVEDKNLQYRKGIKQIQLKNLCVDKTHRGKNIGHQLVEAAKKWAKEQGANNLKVCAKAKNDKACSFYKSCGFEEFEIIHEMKL